ncbi:MAG: hypothetical protein BGN86_12625 [Caulobacterales bacterium 68-7]|nr:MAG: hypothetical protein BGN86_12625 [Caulobacterales bacterium 68-7]
MSEVFRSDNLVVRTRLPHGSTRVIVTFAPWRSDPGLERPGFGEEFLAAHELDGIHVTCAGNDWYQYPEMPEAYEAIRRAAAPYESLITYGVSMGGYQAIKAAAPLNARRVLAISPQASVDPSKAPFETRWPEAKDIDFIDDEIVRSDARYVVVYDPRSPLDAAHARMICAVVGDRYKVVMPFAGHWVLRTWKEAHFITKATLTLLKSKRDTAGVRRMFRELRRDSPSYIGEMIALGRLSPAMEAALKAQQAALLSLPHAAGEDAA